MDMWTDEQAGRIEGWMGEWMNRWVGEHLDR